MKRIKHLFHLCKESLFHGIYPISFSSHKSECETLGVKLTLGIKDEPGAARLELEDQELLLSPCWSCKQQQAISLLRLKLQADTCHIVCAWLYEPFKHVQLGPQVPSWINPQKLTSESHIGRNDVWREEIIPPSREAGPLDHHGRIAEGGDGLLHRIQRGGSIETGRCLPC